MDAAPQRIRDADFAYGLDRVLDGLAARLTGWVAAPDCDFQR
ncbi:hypothetical protein [Streptomyces tauricus]